MPWCYGGSGDFGDKRGSLWCGWWGRSQAKLKVLLPDLSATQWAGCARNKQHQADLCSRFWYQCRRGALIYRLLRSQVQSYWCCLSPLQKCSYCPQTYFMADGGEGWCCSQEHWFTLSFRQHSSVHGDRRELLSPGELGLLLLLFGCLSSPITHTRSCLCPLASHTGNLTRQALRELSFFCPLWNTGKKAQSDLFELISLYGTVVFKIMLLWWASPSSLSLLPCSSSGDCLEKSPLDCLMKRDGIEFIFFKVVVK